MTAVEALVEFLTARLDEREALAKACPLPGPWVNEVKQGYSGGVNVYTVAESQSGVYEGMRDRVAGCAMTVGKFQLEVRTAAFIADNDPAFVLADIVAKRRIVAQCVAEIGRQLEESSWLATALAEETLQLLVQPFSGHRDYRQEWQPS